MEPSSIGVGISLGLGLGVDECKHTIIVELSVSIAAWYR